MAASCAFSVEFAVGIYVEFAAELVVELSGGFSVELSAWFSVVFIVEFSAELSVGFSVGCTVELIVAFGYPQQLAPISIAICIVLLLVGSAAILFDSYAWVGYICYLLFLMPVTLFMHVIPFIYLNNQMIEDTEEKAQHQLIQILKNISMMGSLMLLLTYEYRLAVKVRGEAVPMEKKDA